jgi:hypothetical protein
MRHNQSVTIGVYRGADFASLLAALIALVMAGMYIKVMNSQCDDPQAWVLIVLAVGAALTSYGTWRDAPYRTVSLTVAAVGLLALGVLAILTIGLPILIAGGLALWASQRQ